MRGVSRWRFGGTLAFIAFLLSAPAFAAPEYRVKVIPTPTGCAEALAVRHQQLRSGRGNLLHPNDGTGVRWKPVRKYSDPRALAYSMNNLGQVTGIWGHEPGPDLAFIGTAAGMTAILLPQGWISSVGN